MKNQIKNHSDVTLSTPKTIIILVFTVNPHPDADYFVAQKERRGEKAIGQ